MKKVIFITNLNVLGGTENNLVSLLCHPQFMQSFHACIFSGTRPHPVIMTRLAHTATLVTQYNNVLGIRSPRILRDCLFKRHLQRFNPDVVVFWNHVSRSRQLHICKELGLNTVFFERGTGWRDHDPSGMLDFLSSVDTVLSNSVAGKQIMSVKWGYTGPCLVLPNAVRPEIASVAGVSPPPLANRSLRIGVAARLVAYKGVASMLLAMKILKERELSAELLVAGDGPEGDTLLALAAELDVNVRFYGTVEDMAGFYQEIDVLAVPSIREPFGTVAIEAQALGRPVVCSAVDGLPEVIRHGKTGFIIQPTIEMFHYERFVAEKKSIPSLVYYPLLGIMDRPLALDPKKIASAMEQIAANLDRLEIMSRNAAILAGEKFNFDRLASEIVQVLDNS